MVHDGTWPIWPTWSDCGTDGLGGQRNNTRLFLPVGLNYSHATRPEIQRTLDNLGKCSGQLVPEQVRGGSFHHKVWRIGTKFLQETAVGLEHCMSTSHGISLLLTWSFSSNPFHLISSHPHPILVISSYLTPSPHLISSDLVSSHLYNLISCHFIPFHFSSS